MSLEDCDSDSTLPAKDANASRLLEYKSPRTNLVNLSQGSLPRFQPFISTINLRRNASKKKLYIDYSYPEYSEGSLDAKENEDEDENYNSDADSDVNNQVDESSDLSGDETSALRNPKLMTARQISLQAQREGLADSRTSFWKIDDSNKDKTRTPEQIAAHQRRMDRRRESAKKKAEMEKKLTVERLLKVNAQSTGMVSDRMRGRGRGGIRGHARRGRFDAVNHNKDIPEKDPTQDSNVPVSHPIEFSCKEGDTPGESPNLECNLSSKNLDNESGSSASMLNSSKIASYRQNIAALHGLPLSHADPKPGYYRTVLTARCSPGSFVSFPPIPPSSQGMTAAKYSHPNRLSPQSIASSSMNFQYTAPLTFLDSLFAVKTSKELDSVSPSSIPVELRLCEICKTGSLRRYACPITKRSLCSLACYRENQKLTIQETAIDGLDVVS